MSDKVFKRDHSVLRSKDRLELLEVERVVELCLESIFITKVLDVGTGSGLFAEAFALRNLDVKGIDSNPDMIRVASKLVQDASFEEAIAEALPFTDRSFDLVFLGHLLHESDDPVLALREAKRVARSRVAILEWPYVEGPPGPPLSHRLSTEKLQQIAADSGFHDVLFTPLKHMVLMRCNIARDRKPKKKSGRRPSAKG